MSSFRIKEVAKGASFQEMMPMFWRANTTPRDAGMEFIMPVKGSSKEARDAAVEDSRKRISSEHSQDPSSHWIQVVDSDDTIVAAAEWHIYETNESNPYARDSYPPTDIDWWPEGDTKKFVIRMLDTFLAIGRKRMRRPHMFLSLCFTDPDYRRRGAGTMLVNWGTQIADKLGLECFLTATLDMGMPLYKKADFFIVDETFLDMEIPNPSDEWKACQKQLGNYSNYNMWRPTGGKYEKGEKYPWEEEEEEEEVVEEEEEDKVEEEEVENLK